MITVTDLNIIPLQCVICEEEWEQPRSAPSYGVARYEDEVVPDNWKGDWGGSPVCGSCFRAERKLRDKYPDVHLTFRSILAERNAS